MLFDPILCLALLCVVIAFRPTTAQVLANGLQPQHESLQFMMPKAGTVLSIPNTDLFGRTIDRANDLAVVAMPNCQSCTLRRINWATLEKLSRAPAILVFLMRQAQIIRRSTRQSFGCLSKVSSLCCPQNYTTSRPIVSG